jgi:hypothetical protein
MVLLAGKIYANFFNAFVIGTHFEKSVQFAEIRKFIQNHI